MQSCGQRRQKAIGDPERVWVSAWQPLLFGFLWLVSGAAAWAEPARWDWQLSANDFSVKVDVLNIDPEDVTAAEVRALKQRGIYMIAYVSVGTLENWRDDRRTFPKSVIGRTYGDWPDERFLDIRQIDVLIPLMAKRFRAAKQKGFDAVEPDNMDVYINESGFPITAQHTVDYVYALADLAHSMGLDIAQKNVPRLTKYLAPKMDFAITESCFQDRWCDAMKPYLEASKPVYDAEYNDEPINWRRACSRARDLGISMILKDRDLTGAAKATC